MINLLGFYTKEFEKNWLKKLRVVKK
jgi:hypothetical protein